MYVSYLMHSRRAPEGTWLMTDVTSRRLERARWAVGAVTGLLLLWVLAVYGTHTVNRTFSDLSETAVALLASVNCALAARSCSGRLRLAWGGLAGATLSWAVGQAIWSWYELVQHTATPFPGLADLGFLGFPLGAVLALAIFPSHVSGAHRWRMTLDGLMIACALGLISWATALGAVVHAGGDSLLGLCVSVAYPASDIALLVVCVLVLSRSRAHRVPLAFIAAGLALMAVADSGFAYLVATNSYATGSLVDLGWFFAFGVLAFASLAPGATEPSSQAEFPTVAGAALPYVILGGAIGFVSWQTVTRDSVSIVEMVLMVVIGSLVFFRQFLTVRDNQKLARALAEREAELRYQAFHDPLTGLANRALFIDRATHALKLHQRDGRPLAICFLDLDRFKAVNDQLGHNTGDDLLREVSRRFHERLSDADTLARFGGDEFAVLLEDQLAPIEVAKALLDSLQAPCKVAGREVSVSASIGVARFDPFDPTPTIDELLMRADLAMYVVKRHGGRDVLLHTDGLALEEVDEVALASSLAQALARRQVTVSYQPIVDLSTGRLHTLEALARWLPQGRPLSPEVFVRVAQSCNLTDSLFRFVLQDACSQMARWAALPGGSHIQVAVNITPGQLSSPTLPSFIAAELASHDLAGEQLSPEITETGGLAETAVSRAVCHELRRLGVWLSVDDFGAGQSSLARLRDLPVDEIKIDRSFIGNLDTDEAKRRVVWGVVAFAERIGLTVVAEGLEREAELDALTRLGCHRAQGLLFSRPVPASTVDEFLRTPDNWLLGMCATPPEPTPGTAGNTVACHP